MRKCVFISCDSQYVANSIVALLQFVSHNPDYDKAIIGTTFDNSSKELCKQFDIAIHEVDLSNDFINLDKRPYGLQYPIECFSHFYAYKMMTDYDYIVLIEPDIYIHKKLDVSFESIHYIGGSYKQNHTIRSFPVIKREYSIIRLEFGEGILDTPRILGGLKIYNVKNLHEIEFYEKIVDYYKRSWKIGCPRCGDDSLLALYQLYHSNHIELLDPNTHVISTSYNYNYIDKTKLDAITMIHMAANHKWWRIYNVKTLHPLVRYCYENMIEFIYNHFSLKFIGEHFPHIYCNVDNIRVPFYYWGGSVNFGDTITPYFLKKYCSENEYSIDFNENIPNVISCGSIMRLSKPTSLVYGSGIRDIDQNILPGEIVLVRGPLTRKRLINIGCYCPPEYGDPGLLLPEYYKPRVEKKYSLGIIPHVIHYDIVKEMYANNHNVYVIDLNTSDVERVVDDIVSCEKTVSSSLHGLIVSDAYNIPNKWVKFNLEIKGDDTKFYDYFQSVGRCNESYLNCIDYKMLPDNILDLIPMNICKFDMKRLKKKMFFDEHGLKNYTKYRYMSLIQPEIIQPEIIQPEIIQPEIIQPEIIQSGLLENEYLIWNSYWERVDNDFIAKQNTCLKKSVIHSRHLRKDEVVAIQLGERVRYARRFNDNYMVVLRI